MCSDSCQLLMTNDSKWLKVTQKRNQPSKWLTGIAARQLGRWSNLRLGRLMWVGQKREWLLLWADEPVKRTDMHQQTSDLSTKWNRFRHACPTLSGRDVEVAGRARREAAGKRCEVRSATTTGDCRRTRTTTEADRANQMRIWFF
jgi:hypothetical protein